MSNSIKKTAKSRQAIESIFAAIATRYTTDYPEIIIANSIGGMSAFAPRNWVTRGIPVKHWQRIADLAGISVDEVERAHRVSKN